MMTDDNVEGIDEINGKEKKLQFFDVKKQKSLKHVNYDV
jgi:hypothetical protein